MASRFCPPGSYILDAASFVSLQAVRNAVAHPNCDGISLYNGGRYGCTIEHVKIIADSGKCTCPNWERRADEAMYGAGAWAVDSARAGVEKWGIDPSTVPTILSAVDFGPTAAQYAQLDYWHETACDRADATNTWIGYYGHTGYGEHLIQQPWWQRAGNRPTWTWGGNGMITGTNMKQHAGFPSRIDWSSVGVTVDESRVEAGLVMYAAEGDPIQGGVDMPTVLTIPGVARMLSPSTAASQGGKGHSHASWIESGDEVAYLLQFWPEEVLSLQQLRGIRLIGNAPDSLKALMHQGDSNLSAGGPQGPPGRDGAAGQPGRDGKDGKDGAAGPPGPAPKTATTTYAY